MVVGDLDSDLDTQVDFLLCDVILAEGKDEMGVKGSKECCVVENKRGMVVLVEE